MAEDGKKVAIGLGIVGTVLGTIYLATRAKAAPPIPPSDIIISNLVIEPSTVYIGEPVSISVTATNIGGVFGSHEVTLGIT